MFTKQYILNSLKAVKRLEYRKKDALEGIFAGISSSEKDKEILEECKSAFRILVNNKVLTAKDSEELIRKYLKELLKVDKKKLGKVISPIGPYIDNKRLFADHGRMGRAWLTKFYNASKEERNRIMEEYRRGS
jgi:hypothetical protein